MNEKLIVEAMNAVDRLMSHTHSVPDPSREFSSKANYIKFLLDQARNTGKLERDYLLSAVADAHKMLESADKAKLF